MEREAAQPGVEGGRVGVPAAASGVIDLEHGGRWAISLKCPRATFIDKNHTTKDLLR